MKPCPQNPRNRPYRAGASVAAFVSGARVPAQTSRSGGLPTTELSRVERAQAALDTKRRKTVSHTVSTLLLRNLHDVFGEIDPVRRRAAIDEIFHEDPVFYGPNNGIYRGRDEIDRIAGVIKATHPDFRYQPISLLRRCAIAVGSGGCRAALASRRLTAEPIS